MKSVVKMMLMASVLAAGGTAGAANYPWSGTATFAADERTVSILAGLGLQMSSQGSLIGPGALNVPLDFQTVGVASGDCGDLCRIGQVYFRQGIDIQPTAAATPLVVLSNIALDVTSGSVFADVKSNLDASATRHAIFYGGILTGSTELADGIDQPQIDPSFSVSGFKLGSSFADYLGQTYGLSQGVVAFTQTLNLGAITVPAIPEPSTWLLVALGLGGAALARSRRTASA